MKAHLPARRRRASSICLGLAFGMLLSVAEGQESTTAPQSEDQVAPQARIEDRESQEYRWLQESLEHREGIRLAQETRGRFQDELEAAPEILLNLQRELDTRPLEPALEAKPGLTLEETEELARAFKRVVDSIESELREQEQLSEVSTELKANLSSKRERAQAQLEEAQARLIDRSASGAPKAALDAASSNVDLLRAEIDVLEMQRPALDARLQIIPLKLDLLERELRSAEEQAEFWQAEFEQQRGQVEAVEVESLRDQVAALISQHPELEGFKADFDALAELRSGEKSVLSRRLRETQALQEKRDQLEEVRKRYGAALKREKITGNNELLGLTLRRDYRWLPAPAALRAQVQEVEQALAAAQLDGLELEEARETLKEEARDAERLFGNEPTDSQSSALALIEQLERVALDDLIRQLKDLEFDFAEHHKELKSLEFECGEYRDFIERRILWVRSAAFAPWAMIRDVPDAAVGTARSLGSELLEDPWVSSGNTRMSTLLSGSAVALFLFCLRRVLRRTRDTFGESVRSYRTDRFVLTLRATIQTLLLAMPMPLLGWTLGTGLSQAPGELVRGAGDGLREIAPVWLLLKFCTGLCVAKGVGLSHFRWPAQGVRAFDRELRWFTPTAVGLGWIFLTLARQSNTTWSDSLGRSAFIAVMLALALFGKRLLHERSPLWSAEAGGLLGRGQSAWHTLAQLLPTSLAVAALSGFYYTALEFELRLRWSLGFGFLLLLINALLSRWLFSSRRKLAVRQAMEARVQRARESEAGNEEAQEASRLAFDAERVDIPDVDAKTRQLFRTSLTLASVIGLYFVWASSLPALRGLDRVQLWPTLQVVELGEVMQAARPPIAEPAQSLESSPTLSPLGALGPSTPELEETSEGSNGLGFATRVTLADALLALLLGLLTAVFSKNLPALLELALLQRLPLESGARYAIATIARYLILIVGISATTTALGIGWQKVQWLAAALTFGLAFGLQEIFANFVSGLILLLERPIRVGDIVTVGGTEGRVTQLRMRATTIQDWNRRELLVPNKEFITGNVINWTLTDPITRVVIPIGIAYGSEVAVARKLLLDVARENSLALKDPRPQALFLAFGASSLDFELRVFIANRDVWPDLMDSLHSSIDSAFRNANIEIAFPQRDLHLRSVDSAVIHGVRSRDDQSETT